MWDAISGLLITWYRLIPSFTSVHLIVLLVLGAIHGAMVNRLPMFNDTPVNVTYYTGDRAILQCSVKHLGTNRVIWKREDGNTVLTVGKVVWNDDQKLKVSHLPLRDEWNLIINNVIWKREDGNTVLTVGKVVWNDDQKLKVSHLPLRDEWNLIINNVQPQDAGRYECQISTASVIWKREDGNTVLTVGKVVWNDDQKLKVSHLPLRDEWNLIINNVQPQDAGRYECQISTASVLRRFVRLNVIDSPAPRGESIVIDGQQFIEKGNKISLTCNATGDSFPPEDIDWFKDGVKIKENTKKGVSIVKFRITETKTLHSELVIDRSEMTDSGNYICRSSDLAITSKQVLVLNAESNHDKRDNGKDQTKAARNVESRSSRHSVLYTLVYLLTFVAVLWPH